MKKDDLTKIMFDDDERIPTIKDAVIGLLMTIGLLLMCSFAEFLSSLV